MGRMNAQAAVRAAIQRAMPDVPVKTSVSSDRPEALVVVRREGGRMRDGLVDVVGIGVDSWAPTEAEACDLAMRASKEMLSLPFSEGFAHVREEALRSDYDLKVRSPRWYGSYTLMTFSNDKE